MKRILWKSLLSYMIKIFPFYELDENDSDYDRIVSESKKGMYIESTKNVKKILGLNTEK